MTLLRTQPPNNRSLVMVKQILSIVIDRVEEDKPLQDAEEDPQMLQPWKTK